MVYRRHRRTAPESALADYLAEGRRLLEAATPAGDDCSEDAVSHDFEQLRWFELPGACLVGVPAD